MTPPKPPKILSGVPKNESRFRWIWMVNDLDWMRLTLKEAEKALASGDVPIGALAVYKGEIIGRGYNRREADHDPTAHAEILAIRQAAQHIGHWRLDGVTLYCTL